MSEKWSPSLLQQEERQVLPTATASMLGFSEISRSTVRAMAITYQLLEYNEYIPAVYTTQHPAYRNEWEIKVRRMYQTLDADEHQLLAINNTLMEMRRLRVSR